jgi:hypothetical protein
MDSDSSVQTVAMSDVSDPPLKLPHAEGDVTVESLVAHLGIPQTLVSRSKLSDIRLAWSKYKGYLKAQADLFRMIKDGTWTLKKPTSDELIEVFVSRSVWHDKYRKVFPMVVPASPLHHWLENDSDAPSNIDIFGEEKQLYNFKDLKRVLESQGKVEEGKRESESVGEKSRKKGKQVAKKVL